jgi:hypothetical protein
MENLSLKDLKKRIETFLNLKELKLTCFESKGKLIIIPIKYKEEWENHIHLALWSTQNSLYLTLDLCFCPERIENKEIKEKLTKVKKILKEKFKYLKDKYRCLFDDDFLKEIGYTGLLLKKFNSHKCEILGHLFIALCLSLDLLSEQ